MPTGDRGHHPFQGSKRVIEIEIAFRYNKGIIMELTRHTAAGIAAKRKESNESL